MQSFNLSAIAFPPRITDEKKLYLHTLMVSQQVKLKKAFHFGSDKVSRTIKSYKLNKVTPKSPKRSPTKLMAELLAFIQISC